MAATNFKTENNTFRKLIGNGLTDIPPLPISCWPKVRSCCLSR